MKNLISRIFANKSRIFASGILAVMALSGATAFAGYGPNGPDRVIYDFSNPAQREGAFDAPRFNSYINTNVYGDERAFLDAKECAVAGDTCYTQGQSGGYQDKTTVNAGKEYIVRAYVHNIANPSINTVDRDNDGHMDGIARNTRIRFELPTGIANGFTLQARLSADNAIPQMVYDTADLKNDNTSFAVDYIAGSARIYNASHPTGLALSDNIMTSGTLIGDDVMDGTYPGCFEFSSFVVIRVKVKAQTSTLLKRVRKAGAADWTKVTAVKPGEKVQWIVTFENKGQTEFNDVTISDQLPPHLTVVPGSVRYVDAAQDVVQTNYQPLFTTGGINFGTWKPNGGFHVRFDTTAKDDFASCEVTLRNIAFSKTRQTPTEVQDYADVKITKENCNPTVTPPAPVKPAVATTLPDTGPGDVFGIFASVTAAGAVAHRFILSRRFN